VDILSNNSKVDIPSNNSRVDIPSNNSKVATLNNNSNNMEDNLTLNNNNKVANIRVLLQVAIREILCTLTTRWSIIRCPLCRLLSLILPLEPCLRR